MLQQVLGNGHLHMRWSCAVRLQVECEVANQAMAAPRAGEVQMQSKGRGAVGIEGSSDDISHMPAMLSGPAHRLGMT